NDSLTNEEAGNRVQMLSLASYVPANKLPEIQKSNSAKPEKDTRRPFQKTDTAVTTVVPPDVERALKANGWTAITRRWRNKSDGVYEVTDGKLETNKVNGALQFTVSGSGTATAFVRNDNKGPFIHRIDSGPSSSSSGIGIGHYQFVTGYGVSVNDRECKA